MVNMTLLLSSQDCEFLAAFKKYGSLSELCAALSMDKGQASRRMSRIAGLAPVLTRVQSKWSLTREGEEVVNWYLEALESQRIIMEGKKEVTVGTTQVISDRILIPMTPAFLKESKLQRFKVKTEFGTAQEGLFSRRIDYALVCAIPQSPEIRFKKVFTASYVIVLPASWKDDIENLEALMKRPYVRHSSIDMRQLLNFEDEIPHPVAEFDHLVGVRQGILSGLGWGVLPSYAVESEIKEKKIKLMKKVPNLSLSETFYLWWLPSNVDKKVTQCLVTKLAQE